VGAADDEVDCNLQTSSSAAEALCAVVVYKRSAAISRAAKQINYTHDSQSQQQALALAEPQGSTKIGIR
jgi:hypothetical protein